MKLTHCVVINTVRIPLFILASAMARQRLDFLIVILILVLVSQRDVPVPVPRQDGEAAPVGAAVVKASEGATRAYRDRFYVVPVEEVNRMPPLELHLEDKIIILDIASLHS